MTITVSIGCRHLRPSFEPVHSVQNNSPSKGIGIDKMIQMMQHLPTSQNPLQNLWGKRLWILSMSSHRKLNPPHDLQTSGLPSRFHRTWLSRSMCVHSGSVQFSNVQNPQKCCCTPCLFDFAQDDSEYPKSSGDSHLQKWSKRKSLMVIYHGLRWSQPFWGKTLLFDAGAKQCVASQVTHIKRGAITSSKSLCFDFFSIVEPGNAANAMTSGQIKSQKNYVTMQLVAHQRCFSISELASFLSRIHCWYTYGPCYKIVTHTVQVVYHYYEPIYNCWGP